MYLKCAIFNSVEDYIEREEIVDLNRKLIYLIFFFKSNSISDFPGGIYFFKGELMEIKLR